MNRKERAKQFMPFDALKGLQEELRKREERRLMVEKKELCDEEISLINDVLTRLKKGDELEIVFYRNGRYLRLSDRLKKINTTYKYIQTESDTIYFDDVLEIKALS